MSDSGLVDVLVVGGRFGREFLHLYLSHPGVGRVGVVDPDPVALREIADGYGLGDLYPSLTEGLADGWDAVHVASPVAFHVEQVREVLASGRHCACAVPIARSLEGIEQVIEAAQASKGRYMMMETSLYQREYLHMLALRDEGRLGRLTFLRGSHLQDLDGFPPYWMGYPPMEYATHIVAPLLGLAEARATSVRCLGSGRISDEHRGGSDNPFPLESALFELSEGSLAAEVTVGFFEVARDYTEGFDAYGELGSMEWQSIEGQAPVIWFAQPRPEGGRGRPMARHEEHVPDRADLLPEELRPFTFPTSYTPPGRSAIPVTAWHGGSHPHLVHEFVSCIQEDRPSAIDEFAAARITAPGIVAHRSALHRGEVLKVPSFE